MNRFNAAAALACVVLLSACGGSGPSESDMAAAFKQRVAFTGENPDINVTKHSCEEVDKTTFRCSVTVEVGSGSPMSEALEGKYTITFQKTGSDWRVLSN